MSNATFVNDRNALFITYNNLTMANIMPTQDLTIDCANNKLGTDITIVCLEDRIVTYGGKRTNVSAGKTAVLKCGGKKMVGDVEVLVADRGEEEEIASYLTFSSAEPFTLGVVDNQKYWDGTLEYSTDTSTWNEWDGTYAISSSADGKLYMRGAGNTYITGPDAYLDAVGWTLTGNNIACSGNIETLLDYMSVERGEHPIMEESCYSYMFNNCSSLTTAPELHATTLAYGCYYGMFSGCTSLTTAPELPATTLADSCYSYMFRGCTSLTTAPELPATTLAYGCYYCMFAGCTSLTTAPELPATTLAYDCYSYMFNGCSSLTSSASTATHPSSSGASAEAGIIFAM